MWDESGEFEEIRCWFCDADVSQGCEHILLHVDVTLSQCIGGAARETVVTISDKIAESFRGHLLAGRNPEWRHYEMQELWENIHAGHEGDPNQLGIECSVFYAVVVAILEEAGGDEHQGRLVSNSGPYCESTVRLMYAQNPGEVCEKALAIIDKYLLVEKSKPRPRSQREGDEQ